MSEVCNSFLQARFQTKGQIPWCNLVNHKIKLSLGFLMFPNLVNCQGFLKFERYMRYTLDSAQQIVGSANTSWSHPAYPGYDNIVKSLQTRSWNLFVTRVTHTEATTRYCRILHGPLDQHFYDNYFVIKTIFIFLGGVLCGLG